MDTDVPGSPGPELKEYTALLRRRWRLVGAGVLGGLVLATAGVLAVPSTYTSVAAVQVRPTGMAEFTGEQVGRLTGDVNLDSEAQIAVSDQVTTGMAEALPGDPDPAELRERIDVTVPSNSNILELHYSARSPEAAQEGADALAASYLEHRGEQARSLISGRLEALREEQEELYERLTELATENAAAAGAQQVGTDAQADALRQEIGDLGNGISPLSALHETVSPGQVITPADLPESPSSPVPLLWLVAGAALGLVAGLAAALVRDRLDPRVHDTEDTARIGTVPVLLDLSAPGEHPDRSPGLLTDADPDGQRANELAHLVRARLADAGPDAAGTVTDDAPVPGRVLVVTGTTPGRSGTAAAVNLAAALARTGSETLLVCADPRTGAAAELLGLTEGPGLNEVMVDGEDPADLEVRPAAVPRLRVLRHGRSGTAAPVQGGAAELVELLRPQAEFVVIATAAVGERADAHALAASADLLLPVVELGRTRRADLIGTVTAGARFGVTVPGAITVPRQPGPEPVPAPSAPVPPAPRRPSEAGADTGGSESEGSSDASAPRPRRSAAPASVGNGAAPAGSQR